MTSIRRWHSYIGLLIAPSVLFFSLTGAAQLFNLHEAHGNYHPPALLEKLSSVHQDQVFGAGHHHDQPDPPTQSGDSAADSPAPAEEGKHGDEPAAGTLLLKCYFVLVALGLAVSTAFGLWMGLVQTRRKRLSWLLVAAGTAIPVILLLV
jgi:hypothetical protein